MTPNASVYWDGSVLVVELGPGAEIPNGPEGCVSDRLELRGAKVMGHSITVYVIGDNREMNKGEL